MSDKRLTKNERREAAREAARAAREKAQKRERLLKWLVPTAVSVAIVTIVAIVATVIILNPPPPQSQNGPKNMASGGILFEGIDGEPTPVLTPAIPEGGTPTPTAYEEDGRAHIEAYVDFSCPACKAWEEAVGPTLLQLVAAGQATIEYHPVAILDHAYGARYSTRSNNVGYCVAEYEPESFLPVMTQLFALQPSEGTNGHSNDDLVRIVESAGVENDDVKECIRTEYFAPSVKSLTEYQTSLPNLRTATGFSTPTWVVNGERFEGTPQELLTRIESVITVDTETDTAAE